MPFLSLATAPTGVETPGSIAALTSIRDSIKDTNNDSTFLKSWGKANILGSVRPTPAIATSSTKYWDGSEKYSANTPDRSELVQVIFDVLLSYPYDREALETHNQDIMSITRSYINTTNSIIDPDTIDFIKASISPFTTSSNSPEKEIFHLYHRLRELRSNAQSCHAYWEGTSEMSGYIPPEVMLLDENAQSLPESPQLCQKVVCTTRIGEPFNQFYNINDETRSLRSDIEGLRCDSLFPSNNHPQKNALCKSTIDSVSFSPAQIMSNSVMTLSAGKSHMETLPFDIEKTLPILQVILLSQINDAINRAVVSTQDDRFRNISFSSLYTPITEEPTRCDSTDAINGVYDYCGETPSTTDRDNKIDLFIDTQMGLNANLSAISPGLAMFQSNNSEFYTIVAGKYIKFLPHQQRGGLFWKSEETSENKRLYITNETKYNIEQYRARSESSFYEKRNLMRNHIMQQLTIKSTSALIINNIKSQNSSKLNYRSSSDTAPNMSMLQTLEESSKWRLNTEENNWLTSLSSMSNINILREIVILLAEIKQLTYLSLSVNQQKLLLSVIQTSAEQSQSPADAINSLEELIFTYMSGTSASGSQTVPSDNEQEEAQASATAEIDSAARTNPITGLPN